MKYIQCVSNDNQNVNPKETIMAIKKAGYDGVFLQWYNKEWEFSQEQQLKLCDELDLPVEFVHLGYSKINKIWEEGEDGEELVRSYINDLDACKRNDINMVVMHLTSKSVAPSPSLIGINRFQKIIDYADKLGIKIAFENTKIFGYLEYLFKHISNQNIGICYDSGHCHCHFDDKFSWDIFKGKILALHLHDNDKTSDQHLLPFDGTIDWESVVEHLKKSDYKGNVILESCYKGDYLKMTIEEFYLTSLERAKQINL